MTSDSTQMSSLKEKHDLEAERSDAQKVTQEPFDFGPVRERLV